MMIYLLLLSLSVSQAVGTASKAEIEDQIREAVLKYMFEHSATEQHLHTSTFIIAINKGKDPSDEFMKRFDGHKPIVKKLWQSTYTSDTGAIVDKETGRGAILYNVGSVEWINEKESMLEGSYYIAMLYGGGCRYRVVQEGSKWEVKGCEGGHWES
jgi:hypothetical protein